MNINTKKLSKIDADVVDAMIDVSNQLGVDIIELMWTPFNGAETYSIQELHGFKFPIMGETNVLKDVDEVSEWVEGILKFYPDGKGRCWGYIYDTEENRVKIYETMSTGWFRIVDRNLRETITKEAEEKGYQTQRSERTEVSIKKTEREKNAERHAKKLEERLREKEEEMKRLREELAIAKNEKQVRAERRLKGIKIENREELQESLKGE